MQALSTIILSNLIPRQIFSLYGNKKGDSPVDFCTVDLYAKSTKGNFSTQFLPFNFAALASISIKVLLNL